MKTFDPKDKIPGRQKPPIDPKLLNGPGVDIYAYNIDPKKPKFTKEYNPQAVPTKKWPYYPMTQAQKDAWWNSTHPGEPFPLDADPSPQIEFEATPIEDDAVIDYINPPSTPITDSIPDPVPSPVSDIDMSDPFADVRPDQEYYDKLWEEGINDEYDPTKPSVGSGPYSTGTDLRPGHGITPSPITIPVTNFLPSADKIKRVQAYIMALKLTNQIPNPKEIAEMLMNP